MKPEEMLKKLGAKKFLRNKMLSKDFLYGDNYLEYEKQKCVQELATKAYEEGKIRVTKTEDAFGNILITATAVII